MRLFDNAESRFVMLKMWLLRIHRWITLVFALPLAIVIVTGLILSVEPMVVGAAAPGAVTADTLGALLAEHDPGAKARMLVVRAYAGVVSIGGRADAVHVDIASGEKVGGPGALADAFMTSRRMHETLLADLGWLVTASTIALLVLIAIGIAMGWPRIRNTLAGWHKGFGWFLLPLLILSPLSGLAIAFGVTFQSPPTPAANGTPAASAPVTLAEAVRIVGARHDLSRVTWIRPRGAGLMARLDDGGEMKVFGVTRDGLVPAGRNWPRLIHEGNWSGLAGPLINVVTSIGLVGLLGTGLVLWARRKLRRKPARVLAAA